MPPVAPETRTKASPSSPVHLRRERVAVVVTHPVVLTHDDHGQHTATIALRPPAHRIVDEVLDLGRLVVHGRSTAVRGEDVLDLGETKRPVRTRASYVMINSASAKQYFRIVNGMKTHVRPGRGR